MKYAEVHSAFTASSALQQTQETDSILFYYFSTHGFVQSLSAIWSPATRASVSAVVNQSERIATLFYTNISHNTYVSYFQKIS